MSSVFKPDHCTERPSLVLLYAYQEYLMTFKLMTSQVVQRARPLITHICVIWTQRVVIYSLVFRHALCGCFRRKTACVASVSRIHAALKLEREQKSRRRKGWWSERILCFFDSFGLAPICARPGCGKSSSYGNAC